MSFREVLLWSSYRDKHGSMGMIRKYDRPAALISSVLAAVHGDKKSTLADFLPFGFDKNHIEDAPPTFEELQKKLGRGIKIGQRR